MSLAIFKAKFRQNLTEFKYKCKKCSEKFRYKSELTKHCCVKDIIQKKKKPKKIRQRLRQIYTKKINDNWYISRCPICYSIFNTYDIMVNHYIRIHTIFIS